MDGLIDESGNLFDLAGLDFVVNNCTDAEYESMTDDYVAALESLADGHVEMAKERGLWILERLLDIEARLFQERQKMAA